MSISNWNKHEFELFILSIGIEESNHVMHLHLYQQCCMKKIQFDGFDIAKCKHYWIFFCILQNILTKTCASKRLQKVNGYLDSRWKVEHHEGTKPTSAPLVYQDEAMWNFRFKFSHNGTEKFIGVLQELSAKLSFCYV